jgi:hypothetical protein
MHESHPAQKADFLCNDRGESSHAHTEATYMVPPPGGGVNPRNSISAIRISHLLALVGVLS